MEIITNLGAKEIFLENLKFFMDKNGMSCKDLGDVCGFSKQRTSDLFNKPNNLNLNTTDHVSKSIGLKENELFSDNFQSTYKKRGKND